MNRKLGGPHTWSGQFWRIANQLVVVTTTLSSLPVGGLSKEIFKHTVGKVMESSIHIKNCICCPLKIEDTAGVTLLNPAQ
jgi:hypothetical protein